MIFITGLCLAISRLCESRRVKGKTGTKDVPV